MSKEKYRSRVHMLLLYPEDQTHVKALEKIKQSYDYACILHDKDIWTEEDEKLNPDHKQGIQKKAHWHVVLRCSNATWSTAICKDLGIEHNYIEDVKKFDNALQYLIHYNDTNKTQYTTDEVQGSLKQKLLESINKVEKSEGEKVTELIEYIESNENYITITDFAKYCAVNGYWSEFRRSGAIFCKIIDEHNRQFQVQTTEDFGYNPYQ